MPRDIAPLLGARALRDFGDGFVAVLLPVYLAALGLGPFEIGVFATLALLGSALTTLAIGLVGARFDQRRLLIAASVLMVASGVALALASSVAVILLVAFVGTINPSSGNVSIFVPLEHAVLTRPVAAAARTRLFARYSLVGAMAAAVGALAAASPQLAEAAGVPPLTTLKAMFVLYALLGIGGARPDHGMGARTAARPRRLVADGRADALLLRHGGGDAGRAAGRGERHVGAAQPRLGREPGARRRALRRRLRGLAAGDLRRAEDP